MEACNKTQKKILTLNGRVRTRSEPEFGLVGPVDDFGLDRWSWFEVGLDPDRARTGVSHVYVRTSFYRLLRFRLLPSRGAH